MRGGYIQYECTVTEACDNLIHHSGLQNNKISRELLFQAIPKQPTHRMFSNSDVHMCVKFKPIFHQNAKYLASGVGVGKCTRRQNCALPNTKYTNMLVNFALADAHFLRYPTPNPRRQTLNLR